MLDEFRSTLITWDKATSRIYSPVTANTSDENGRKLVVQVVNSGQVEDLTGATLHLYWITIDKRHDGLDVFKAVDLKKGEFELSYTTGMLSNKGVLNANLVLIDTVGRVVSERFKITVTEGIDNDAIQSENSFSSLTQALIDVSNLEQNYAPRLNDLTAQLQQTDGRLDTILVNGTPTEGNTTLLDGAVSASGTNFGTVGSNIRKTQTGEALLPKSITPEKLNDEVMAALDSINLPYTEGSRTVTNAFTMDAENKFPRLSVASAPYPEVVVKQTGDNLFDLSDYLDQSEYVNMQTAYYAKPIYLKPNTTYTVFISVKNASLPPTLTNAVIVNEQASGWGSEITGINLKLWTSDHYQTLTTSPSGLLYLNGPFIQQGDLDIVDQAFDITIVEGKETVSTHIPYKGKEDVHTAPFNLVLSDLYDNVVLNTPRHSQTEMTAALSDITGAFFSKRIDYTKLSSELSIPSSTEGGAKKGLEPLYVDSIAPLMRYGRYAPTVMMNDTRNIEDGAAGNCVFQITGTAGNEYVTVIGGTINLSEIGSEKLIAGVIGYDDKTYKACSLTSVDVVNNRINIYPALEKDITAGEIGNLCVDGLHLSRRGYRTFSQNVFNTPPKYAEKGTYTDRFSPSLYLNDYDRMVPIPNSGRMFELISEKNIQETADVIYSRQTYHAYNPWDVLLEAKSGRQVTLNTYGKSGYCEVIVGGITPNHPNFKIRKDVGFEMYIEFYSDGVLRETYVKKDNPIDTLHFDFSECSTVKVVFYYNKVRQDEDVIVISDITCWVNDYDYGDELLPRYKSAAQMFDSWGEFHNEESAVEMKRLIDERDKVSVRYENNSLGSQTSQWGIDNFYSNVEAYRPQTMLIDFGINDANLGLTETEYKANMLKLIDMAIANSIQPIICFPSFGNLFLGDRQLLITHQEKVQ